MSPSPWDRDPFFQYPLTRCQTSAGEIDMPILYYDCSIAMALFMVDVDRAAALVRDPGLQVLRVAGGKTLVGVAFYEYRQTAIGAYNEVGVAIAVAPTGVRVPALPLLSYVKALDRNPLGFHIVDLPVTTEAACAAGREVWSYPKFVSSRGWSPLRMTAASWCAWQAGPASACAVLCWIWCSTRATRGNCCAPWCRRVAVPCCICRAACDCSCRPPHAIP